MPSKIPREELIAGIQRLKDDLGKVPTCTEMEKHGEYSTTPYYSTFESWRDAVRAADFEPRGKTISREELLREIQGVADDLGRTPAQSEITKLGDFSATPYRDKFGSVPEAIEAAGYNYDEAPHGNGITKEVAIHEMQRVGRKLGGGPTQKEMREHGEYGREPYRRLFGTWDNALAAAGFETRKMSKQDVIDAIWELAEDRDTTPTRDEMDKYGSITATTAHEKFGSWNEALRAAGFEPNAEPHNWSKEQLIEHIQELSEDVGGRPTIEDLLDADGPGVSPYYTKFESWNAATEAAGFGEYEYPTGPDNHAYQGGNEDYSVEWTPGRRRSIRERDGYRCQICGMSQARHYEEYDRKLHVHHVKPADGTVERDQPENLLTLCSACHVRWEGIPLQPVAEVD